MQIILVCDDDKEIVEAIEIYLQQEGFHVLKAYDGEEALEILKNNEVHLLIMDVMMPKLDGISVLKKVRASGNRIPILMLTAKSEIEDRVLGLDSGANDYLPKPFDTRELLARIRAITRTKEETDTKLGFGNITLDMATFELSSPTGSFRLANKEYQMMEYFLSNPRRIISAEQFMEKIWGYDSDAEINVVWVYISYLRKKLTALGADIAIKASRNAGYSLEVCDDK